MHHPACQCVYSKKWQTCQARHALPARLRLHTLIGFDIFHTVTKGNPTSGYPFHCRHFASSTSLYAKLLAHCCRGSCVVGTCLRSCNGFASCSSSLPAALLPALRSMHFTMAKSIRALLNLIGIKNFAAEITLSRLVHRR